MRIINKIHGPRLLIKVQKFNSQSKFENSSLFMPDSTTDYETTNQTVAEVVKIGDLAFKSKSYWTDGICPIEVGEKIYFSKYGAQRVSLKNKTDQDYEYWIIMDKDVMLTIELVEEPIEKVKDNVIR